MTTLEDAVVAAIKQDCNTIHIVPDQHKTYVRIGSGAKMNNWRELSPREGSALIASAKQSAGLPVRRDKELSGDAFIYAGARRAFLKVQTQPYKGDSERVIIRISAS